MPNRRDHVPFDAYYFEKQAHQGMTYSMAETFQKVYDQNHWGEVESVSGAGASADQTHILRQVLPALLAALEVRVVLDAPCGDFSWMQGVAMPGLTYVGADIVPALIRANQARYGALHRQFVTLDLTTDALPPADLLLCRDGLVHLSFADIHRVFANLKRSRVRYVLTTTFPACGTNADITTGDWRPLNLEQSPFNFPSPRRLLNEGCTEGGGRYGDKSLGLWEVADLPDG